MEPDEYAFDVLYRLRERYRRRVEAGDPDAPAILAAVEGVIQEHEERAASVARRRPGVNRGRRPPA